MSSSQQEEEQQRLVACSFLGPVNGMLDFYMLGRDFFPPVAKFGAAIFISAEDDEIYLCRSCNETFLPPAANLLISERCVWSECRSLRGAAL